MSAADWVIAFFGVLIFAVGFVLGVAMSAAAEIRQRHWREHLRRTYVSRDEAAQR